MPTGKNWMNFVYVNLGFAAYIYGMILISSLQEIRANWPLYRCNPMYMPLSPNIESDFIYCIQGMQTSFMGYLLEPLTFIANSITNIMGGFSTDINFVRAMINKIRTFFSTIIQSVFGVFLNLVIEFQKITIGIVDMVGKLIGVVVTFMYILDGSIQTMQSAWSGPPGQMVQAVGSCFYPETKIKLQDGNIVAIKDINLGDILENGSRVESTMKIDNKENKEDLYIIKNNGVNGENIYVTGTHLVYDEDKSKFILVKDYSKAVKSDMKSDWFSCLITSDHKIHIGTEIFWDWEDHFMKYKMFQ